jgi:hypothetical protein
LGIRESWTNLLVDQLDFRARPLSISNRLVLFQDITTKPVIYLINLTMKDYLRQKCKYLPKIAEWVKVPRRLWTLISAINASSAGLSSLRDHSFSSNSTEKSLRDDKPALDAFMAEIKVQSRLGKITTEGTFIDIDTEKGIISEPWPPWALTHSAILGRYLHFWRR